MRLIRIHDGFAWTWESQEGFLRVTRGRRVSGNIEDYAEKLVQIIQEESE